VLETDLVLSAVGLRSATRLAADAGLLVGRGIVVDAHLRTTDPNIYALGDCAEIFGQVLPYVMPIMNGARVLASVLTGEERALVYPPMPVLVKTTLCPVVICPPSGPGHWEETQSEGGVVSRHVDDHGKLTGFALVGEATRERAARLKELEA
jgi:rubredoxin-NAD+ reductase